MLLSYTQLRKVSAGERPEPERTPLKCNRPISVRSGAPRPLAPAGLVLDLYQDALGSSRAVSLLKAPECPGVSLTSPLGGSGRSPLDKWS